MHSALPCLQALLLLDADFVPTPSLVEEYRSAEGYAEMMRQLGRGQAVVLPAFETASAGEDGKQLAMAAVQRECGLALCTHRSWLARLPASAPKHLQENIRACAIATAMTAP
jgi:hypothetical protein